MGRGGELYCSQIHGKYYTAAYYARLFSFNVTAVTVPVIVGTLQSKFTVYNPPNSTTNAELVDFDLGIVLVTLVVDTVGLYWQSPTLASLATLSTIGVFGTNWFSSIFSSSPGQVTPYSALTHSGTPARIAILSQFGAVTSTNDSIVHYDFDGKILVPPGHVVSVAMSTGAGDTAGLDLGIRWLETGL